MKKPILVAIILVLLTLVKAIFEIISPIFIIFVFWKNKKHLIICLLIFEILISGYKFLNFLGNGHYCITNRGNWALYGQTVRRVYAKDLTPAILYTGGEGLCKTVFKDKCDYWSFYQSDSMAKDLPFTDSLKLIERNPIKYSFLTFLEPLKMLFWESTKIGWVEYPKWLSDLYKCKWFNYFIRITMALLSILCFWRIRIIFIFLMIYFLIHSPFFILTRYAIPISSLFLISIAFGFDILLKGKI